MLANAEIPITWIKGEEPGLLYLQTRPSKLEAKEGDTGTFFTRYRVSELMRNGTETIQAGTIVYEESVKVEGNQETIMGRKKSGVMIAIEPPINPRFANEEEENTAREQVGLLPVRRKLRILNFDEAERYFSRQ